MNRYDDELIAGLAEGTLTPAEIVAAEAVVAANPEAAAALTAHRVALATTRSAEQPSLTDGERMAMRAGVASAIGIDMATGTITTRPRRTISWAAVAMSAAAVFAVVTFAPMLNRMGGDDAGSAEPTIESARFESDASRQASLDENGDPILSFGIELPAEGEDGLGSDPQTVGSTLVAADYPPETTSDTTTKTTITTLLTTTTAPVRVILRTGDESLLDELTEASELPDNMFETAPPADNTSMCIDEARLALESDGDDEMFFFEHTRDDETRVLVFFTDAESVMDNLVALDPADCEMLALSRP